MADPQFFTCAGPFTLSQIAEVTGAEIAGQNPDPNYSVADVAPLSTATEKSLSFLDNKKYKDQFMGAKAGVCIIHPDMQGDAPSSMHLLLHPSPYLAYAKTAQLFYPEPKPAAGIEEGAIVHDTVKFGNGCTVEAGAIIKAGATIGDHCWIESGAVIGQNVKIGNHCRIGSNATISHSLIGNNVRLYPGVRVGQDGFGFAIDPSGFVKVPQLGRVIIEDHVEIGANTTIDRGAGPDTVVEAGSWIDNLVQIGHNVRIGRGCVIVAQVGISGSTELGDYVMIGGQGGLAGHLKIGSGAKIAAQSGVMRDIPPGEEHMGSPSIPLKQFMRQTATLARMARPGKKS